MKNRSLNTSYSKKKSIIFAKSNIFANISTGLLISHMVRGIDELKWSLKILSCLYLKLFCNIFSKFAKWLPVPVPIQCTLRYHIEPLGERGLCKLLFVYIYKKLSCLPRKYKDKICFQLYKFSTFSVRSIGKMVCRTF